ncbi:hypothetical protein [Exiguobacterium mexicanum]|uniref:hypothetical protein n=1 Tax=Exiguobacterium mexicanum TaxID=340146 RepID=UPI0037BE6699
MITVATAPLLVNLRHVFDYVLVDESDAFPFAFDLALWWMLRRAGKGLFLFVTATPTVSATSVPDGASVSALSRPRLARASARP